MGKGGLVTPKKAGCVERKKKTEKEGGRPKSAWEKEKNLWRKARNTGKGKRFLWFLRRWGEGGGGGSQVVAQPTNAEKKGQKREVFPSGKREEGQARLFREMRSKRGGKRSGFVRGRKEKKGRVGAEARRTPGERENSPPSEGWGGRAWPQSLAILVGREVSRRGKKKKGDIANIFSPQGKEGGIDRPRGETICPEKTTILKKGKRVTVGPFFESSGEKEENASSTSPRVRTEVSGRRGRLPIPKERARPRRPCPPVEERELPGGKKKKAPLPQVVFRGGGEKIRLVAPLRRLHDEGTGKKKKGDLSRVSKGKRGGRRKASFSTWQKKRHRQKGGKERVVTNTFQKRCRGGKKEGKLKALVAYPG